VFDAGGNCQRQATKGATMQIDKEQIVDMLRERGDDDKAEQAKQQLPDKVDHEEHGDLLDSLGVQPDEVVQKLKF
jgi:predicted PhzF superfamily epimerase YddE/YHI9